MKNFLLFVLALFCAFVSGAQQSSEKKVWVKLRGILVDSSSSSHIAGATVEVSTVDPSGSFQKKTVTTTSSGSFAFDKFQAGKNIVLTIYAIGYKSLSKTIPVEIGQGNNAVVDMNTGSIKLAKEYKALNAVIVSSKTKSLLELQSDKRIFHADRAIVSQGGTAVDLMKTIPSVSIDADGNVSMRNSTPQILVDGRPTFLTPDQIPADMIEKIELITNPASRFDASASGGIINIILKKNKTTGFNGIASIGGGSPGLFNSNLNLNFRQQKFNLFGGGNYNRSGGVAKEESFRYNKSNDVITDYFSQESENERLRQFHSFRIGADYYLTKKTTLSFVQNFNRGNNESHETQHQFYLDSNQTLTHSGLRLADRYNEYKRNSSRLSIEAKMRNDEKITADVTLNTSKGNNGSDYLNSYFLPDGANYADDNRVRSNGSDNGRQFISQVDYSRKFNDKKSIEAGLRFFYNRSKSDFNTYQVSESQVETKLPFNNDYHYTENVSAGYFNYSNKWKSFSYQAGLRIELSHFKGTMQDSSAQFGYDFPDGLKNLNYAIFPSLFVSKPLNENADIQFSYSKRIRRPNFWQANPYVDINDPLNIRVGNPLLKPEYTNSFELNYFNRLKKDGSILASLYFKNNVGDITQYSDTISTALYQQLNNASVSPDAILNSYINAGYTNRTGLELILQQKFFNQLDITYSGEFQYRTTKARTDKMVLDNSGFNFGSKLSAGYRFVPNAGSFFNNLSLQLMGEYEGPRVIPQGRIKGQFVSDFAVRKEFLKKRAAAVSFSINDIFNSQKFGTIYDTDKFYQDSYRRWSVRTFRLTFTYRFGNTKIDLFNKKNRSEKADDERETEPN